MPSASNILQEGDLDSDEFRPALESSKRHCVAEESQFKGRLRPGLNGAETTSGQLQVSNQNFIALSEMKKGVNVSSSAKRM